MNRAFYFLSQGATTTEETSTSFLPSGMTGIGNQKAARSGIAPSPSTWRRRPTTRRRASPASRRRAICSTPRAEEIAAGARPGR
jgi:hypothetical protein